jgi:hypothetical protein
MGCDYNLYDAVTEARAIIAEGLALVKATIAHGGKIGSNWPIVPAAGAGQGRVKSYDCFFDFGEVEAAASFRYSVRISRSSCRIS